MIGPSPDPIPAACRTRLARQPDEAGALPDELGALPDELEALLDGLEGLLVGLARLTADHQPYRMSWKACLLSWQG
jgi:hypothetical protein